MTGPFEGPLPPGYDGAMTYNSVVEHLASDSMEDYTNKYTKNNIKPSSEKSYDTHTFSFGEERCEINFKSEKTLPIWLLADTTWHTHS